MEPSPLHTVQTFTLENIPDLDTVVLAALELFISKQLPPLPTIPYSRPLVVGSGNAEATGRILFEDVDAVFASESNYEAKLKAIPAIDGVVLISASGGKHAPIIARRAKELGKRVTLITTKEGSEASKVLLEGEGDSVYVMPKNREPYTYNTSTYLSMILAKTGESPEAIMQFIKERIDTIAMPAFGSYNKFYLIVPSEFTQAVRMFQVKFIELFGRMVARDVETVEYVRHATTVVPSDELFISFGYENTSWGEEGKRLNIPLPEGCGYGAMIAIAYYVIGKIQKAHPPYFKQHIASYTESISKVFDESILPIVE